ncbi:MAG TPA: YqgE/AlgH family protein [Steroidobacteraceae bacterium]|nr:YqgE/AlgH family protein [Steroidobacteraceae bacterium]
MRALLRLAAAVLPLLPIAAAPAPTGPMETAAPAIFLVAKPELLDPNFAQAVVLVVFPKDGGPVGVILNRPLTLTLKDAFPDQPQLRDRSEHLYFGGPVSVNALMFLMRRSPAPQNAFPVTDDLYLSGDGELLDRLLAKQEGTVERFFLGYAGWAMTQFEFEVAQGAWYVIPADEETVLKADPQTLWRDLILRATAIKA